MASTGPESIDWSRIKALSFDIFGTLIDWENGIANAARATVLAPYLPTAHQTLMRAIEVHDVNVQKEHPDWLQSDVIAEGLRRYANELGIASEKEGDGKLSAEQVDKACKEYGTKIGEYPAFYDTVEAMKRLGKRFHLVPLSNVDRQSFSQTLEGPLKGVSFSKIYTAQDIGSYKPDLRNFHYLLEHIKTDLDVEKDELVHVAQSLFHDHGPAKEVGLQSVWVDRKGFMGDPTHTSDEEAQEKFGFQLKVETLAELADIVDSALGKESS